VDASREFAVWHAVISPAWERVSAGMMVSKHGDARGS
jgi:hypothetical protein